jgi:hypothetical protein
MQIELRLKSVQDFAIRAYDPNDDDIRSILMDVCRAIAAQSEFVVSGFGQERWPVDVETDLPVFLKQLPSALHAVQDGVTTEIDFYEQGIERVIALEPADGKYLATCTSQTRWQPIPTVEEIPGEELEEMLLTAREAFMRTLAAAAPELHSHPWVLQWLRGTTEQE